MMSWFDGLPRREDRRFDFFKAHGETREHGAQALRSALNGGGGPDGA